MTPTRYSVIDTIIGFDPLADFLGIRDQNARQQTEPACDLQETGEDRFRLTLAVAGFKLDELNISTRDGRLIVAGHRQDDRKPGTNFLHKEIATGDFERIFQLAEHVSAQEATLKDGLLHIDLVREIPDELKPRRIEIKTSTQPLRLESNDNRAA